MGQRVFEEAAVPKSIADARFKRVKRLRQRHDYAADLLAMAVDDAHGFRRFFSPHRDLRFAERVQRERKQAWRRSGGAQRLDTVAVEERLDHVRLDV